MITINLPPSLRHRELDIFSPPYRPVVGTYYYRPSTYYPRTYYPSTYYYRPSSYYPSTYYNRPSTYYYRPSYISPYIGMGRRRIQRCNTAELKSQLLEAQGGKWYRPHNPYDEVFPGILLGDAETALSTILLKDLGVTHVLNAAQGHNSHLYNGYVSTHPSYYSRKGIKYLGVPAMDMPGFYLKPFFRQASEFIQECLNAGGKVLVHCQSGVSRSAALVVGFLMLKRGMNVQTALSNIKKKRSIFPNHGFLSQLCDLDYELRRSGDVPDDPHLRLLDVQRDLSPERNPDSYPRFSLLNSKALETYSNTKSYVPPRRAVSCERYVSPAKSYANNPHVDTRASRSRQRSPARYTRSSSVSLSPYIDSDDEDLDSDPINSKVFDTYRRYSRRSTSPLPTATTVITTREAKPYDPYWSPKTIDYDYIRYPRYIHYDKYYSPATTYQYINNLNRYYDTYKYAVTRSPFFGEGVTQAPYIQWYDYPSKTYLSGHTYNLHYPYTDAYLKPMSKYPTTTRTLNTHGVHYNTFPLRSFDRL